MYHPNIGVEVIVPDDEGCIAVMQEADWLLSPEPVVVPGFEPFSVTYEPVIEQPPEEVDDLPKAKRSTAKAKAEAEAASTD
jgi:hypothetical protein